MSGRNQTLKNLVGNIFLCGLIFNFTVSAQQSVVPIAYSNYLIGGAKNGKWLTAAEVAPILEKKFEFVPIGLKRIETNAAIFGGKGDEFGACPDVPSIKFASEKEFKLLIGTNAKWNFVPRISQPIAANGKANVKTIADFLKTQGIKKTKIKITQAFAVDLDGDGRKENVFAGNYYAAGMQSGQHRGDYSFVLVRKNVKGKLQNLLVEGDFFTVTGDDYSPPNEREIVAIADLNGDRKMEIVLHTFYYEGEWATVYQLENDKLKKVLEVDCGL